MATWHLARYVGLIENSTRAAGWIVVHMDSEPQKSARGAATDEEVALMVGGTVKWFSEKKGYGFIAPDDGGEDLFVYYTSIEGSGFRSLDEGERVSYEAVESRRGIQANNVRKLGPLP